MSTRIAVLCATRRGYRVLERLFALLPDARFLVFSFQEEPHEPPFLEEIQSLALAHGAEFHEARQVGAERWQAVWDAAPIDLLLVISWRYLIPPEVYTRPVRGCYVFHDSLLPRYRGFSPTVWALVNGETQTGATLFAITEGMDDGDIVAQHPVAIGPDDAIADVMERVTLSYLSIVEDALPRLVDGSAVLTPQDHARATYTCRRLPEDNRIEWANSTDTIYNLIRAVTRPYPGALTTLEGRRLIVWGARRLDNFPYYIGRIPGRVIQVKRGEGSIVLTGDGALLVTTVQFEGDSPARADEVLTSLSHTLGR